MIKPVSARQLPVFLEHIWYLGFLRLDEDETRYNQIFCCHTRVAAGFRHELYLYELLVTSWTMKQISANSA